MQIFYRVAAFCAEVSYGLTISFMVAHFIATPFRHWAADQLRAIESSPVTRTPAKSIAEIERSCDCTIDEINAEIERRGLEKPFRR